MPNTFGPSGGALSARTESTSNYNPNAYTAPMSPPRAPSPPGLTARPQTPGFNSTLGAVRPDRGIGIGPRAPLAGSPLRSSRPNSTLNPSFTPPRMFGPAAPSAIPRALPAIPPPQQPAFVPPPAALGLGLSAFNLPRPGFNPGLHRPAEGATSWHDHPHGWG